MCLGVPGRVSTIDLLPHLPDISTDRIVDALRGVRPDVQYLAVPGRSGEGIDAWVNWRYQQEVLVTAGQPAESSTCR